jgi:hypothetical protein
MKQYSIFSPEGILFGFMGIGACSALMGAGVSGLLRSNDAYLSAFDPSQHPLILSSILVGGFYSSYKIIKESIRPLKENSINLEAKL